MVKHFLLENVVIQKGMESKQFPFKEKAKKKIQNKINESIHLHTLIFVQPIHGHRCTGYNYLRESISQIIIRRHPWVKWRQRFDPAFI